MIKCLKSDLYRLIRGRGFYIFTVMIIILSILAAFNNVPKFELYEAEWEGKTTVVQRWEAFSTNGEIVYETVPGEDVLRENKSRIMLESFKSLPLNSALYTFLFIIITEFLSERHKTMKNKVTAGITRSGILLSKFILTSAVYTFTYLIHVIATAGFILAGKEDILVKAEYLEDSVLVFFAAGLLIISLTVLMLGIFYSIGPYACVALAVGFAAATVGLSTYAENRLAELQKTEIINGVEVVTPIEDASGHSSEIERTVCKGIIYYNPLSALDPDELLVKREMRIRSVIIWFVIYDALSVLCFRKMERL